MYVYSASFRMPVQILFKPEVPPFPPCTDFQKTGTYKMCANGAKRNHKK